MAIAATFVTPNEKFTDANNLPLAGGFLYFYAIGTTTLQDTFSDRDLTVGMENTNPIELNANGQSNTAIFLQALSYTVTLKNALGVTEPGWPRDLKVATP